MAIGEWTEMLQTGWPSIDSSNKQFLDLMKAKHERNVTACDTPSDAMIQDLFCIYVYEHFASEEILMYNLNQNGTQEHAAAHTVIIETSFQLISQQRAGFITNVEVLELISNDFITHVIKYDKSCYNKYRSVLSDAATLCILSSKGRFQR